MNKPHTTFPNLQKRAAKEIRKKYKEQRDSCGTVDQLNKALAWHGKQYKKNPYAQFMAWLKKQEEKELLALNEDLDSVANAEPRESPFIITVEWKRSRMWGSNPTAHTNRGTQSGSIGGCGYDKRSTATAHVLNEEKDILRALYAAKEAYLAAHPRTTKNNSDIHRECLSYGAGYSVLPHFEGGVGFSAHRRILEKVGYEITETGSDSTDVFIITRKNNKRSRV